MNYSVAAAALAERSLALEEAAGHYRRAIDMAEMVPRPDPRLHLTLTIRLGELLNGVGDPQARAMLCERRLVPVRRATPRRWPRWRGR